MTVSALHRRSVSGFTLVEIMIVCAIIGLLLAIAVPSWLRARKRSQATTGYDDLRSIDSAVDQYALEKNLSPGDEIPPETWQEFFFKSNSRLHATGADILGQPYGPQYVDSLPVIPRATFDALSDVVQGEFWSPFKPADH
jgi:prepilin-type N-terminal cleavage/methylation domain-containing protein